MPDRGAEVPLGALHLHFSAWLLHAPYSLSPVRIAARSRLDETFPAASLGPNSTGISGVVVDYQAVPPQSNSITD